MGRLLLNRRRFGLALAALAPLPALATDRLVITGSSTIAPLALEIAKRFELRRSGVRVDVQSGGSSRGIADVRRGVAQIGMVSRALVPSEVELAAHAIARDGVAIILHRGNHVRALSDGQVRAIYTGRITDWRELGGPPGPITVVNKAEGRSTLELFLQHFQLNASEIRAHVVIGENQQGIKTVAGNPRSIGYVSIGSAESEAALGAPIRLMAMNGIEASTARVRDGSFPLSRPLNLVTLGPPSPLAREFLAYAQSAAVHDLVKDAYFVPLAGP